MSEHFICDHLDKGCPQDCGHAKPHTPSGPYGAICHTGELNCTRTGRYCTCVPVEDFARQWDSCDGLGGGCLCSAGTDKGTGPSEEGVGHSVGADEPAPSGLSSALRPDPPMVPDEHRQIVLKKLLELQSTNSSAYHDLLFRGRLPIHRLHELARSATQLPDIARGYIEVNQ